MGRHRLASCHYPAMSRPPFTSLHLRAKDVVRYAALLGAVLLGVQGGSIGCGEFHRLAVRSGWRRGG